MGDKMTENRGKNMHDFCTKIFPYCRSLTGEGVRQTLNEIKSDLEDFDSSIKFDIINVPSGTQVFDWTVPKEWKINTGYIEDDKGNRIVDFKNSNLHIVGYSTPIDKWVNLEELLKHIYTQPEQPNVIPYVTSYYKERFGFCMSENLKNSLKEGNYHMYIDSELFEGVLNYAECIVPGRTEKEIFFSTYICHPSMANNECSGPAVQLELIKYISKFVDRKYTYRFVFVPETIGSLAYLSTNDNLDHMKKCMVAGFNLSCVGDDRNYSIIETRYADTLADKALHNILKFHIDNYKVYDFLLAGSDEKQYGSPFIELPVVGFCRTKYGEFPEYHTSADDLENVVTPSGLRGAYEVLVKLVRALEYNDYYKINVLGVPQLGKRGLYPTVSQKGNYGTVKPMIDTIRYLDGKNDIFDISNRINVSTDVVIDIIDKLKEKDLVRV